VTSDYDTFTTDVIMVSDYKGLLEAKHFLHFKKYDDDLWERMSKVVPPEWRDEGGYWLGYAVRVRAALVNRQAVAQEDRPRSYMDLADPKWKGRMTQRVSSNVYNRSVLAYMISRYGEEAAAKWAHGVAANVADDGYLNDVLGAIAVAEGKYDIGFSNTYYLGYMVDWYEEEPDVLQLVEKSLDIAWLDEGHGAFGNLTGIAISSWVEDGTEKEKNAQGLVEFLLSKRGQELMSQYVFKYPVRADAEIGEYLKGHGPVRLDRFDVNRLRYHYDAADRIMKKAGWQTDW
jgi:iron(III) transport system substrate-binding protein